MKTSIHINFPSELVLGFVIDYAWISKLFTVTLHLHDGRERCHVG